MSYCRNVKKNSLYWREEYPYKNPVVGFLIELDLNTAEEKILEIYFLEPIV